MTRRLVAVLPCRCNSTRLWAKPLQPIAPGLSICEYLALTLNRCEWVSEVRLAIARGPGQDALIDLARRSGLGCRVGPEADVLGRVIACAREAGATDVLRKTSEDPFLHAAMLEPAWHSHVEHANDVTAVDLVPEGAGFEIFTLAALERCHEHGDAEDREHIANYARFHQGAFAVEILRPEQVCRRPDLRVTVDNPEDLIVCRAIHRELARGCEPIPLGEIVGFLDDHPELTGLVRCFLDEHPTWLGVAQRETPRRQETHV
jgi:spore coat polysaccharide biosynthesis protein SpsF